MADTYRPGDRDRPPPLADRMTFTGGRDNYRSGGAHAHQDRGGNRPQFTFESNHPAPHFPPTGPANAGGRGMPRRRNRGGASQRDSRHGDHHNSSYPRGRGNGNGFRRGGFRKAAPHERALLQHRDDGTPERAMGISDGPNRFLNLDDLSDDDEADMDVESDDSAARGDAEADSQNGNHKVARTLAISRADGDSVPKWSNPDPYTVLPPPEETTGKKTDFVKLIRKAKNQLAEKGAGHNAVAANDDFISFGDDDDGTEAAELRILEDEVPVQPRQQRSVQERPSQGALNEQSYIDDVVNDSRSAYRTDDQAQYPVRSNKRKHVSYGPAIVAEWESVPNMNPTPWVLSPQAYRHLARDPDKWLHNEILDFYDFVEPQPYEHELRNQLVNRVQNALGTRRFPQDSGRVLCFGSFPAGLYLPTADMDLVYTSDRHYNGGPPVLDFSQRGAHKSLLYKASRRLTDTRMTKDKPLVIASAKVPIIKFTDSITGLQVDISFENLSGVQAQATFAHWKRTYPDMIYMVALLKQFLVMRGLNEVHTGGIGGFSIICLIVSYIHHAPKHENLGECFRGFLDYYGNKFDLATQRLQMHPPGVVNKTRYGIDDREEKADGLSIQDPNRPENNISGGSHKAKDAFKAFASAHRTLEDRRAASKAGQNIGPSILECVLGGNYETYLQQRQHMKNLNQQHSDPVYQLIQQALITDDEWARALGTMIQVQMNGGYMPE